MQKSIATAAILAIAASQASAHLLYEGFDYPDSSFLSSYNGDGTNAGQVNSFGPTWQTAGTTAATDFIQVASPGITAPGVLGGVGNAASWGGDGNASRLPIGPFFTPATSDTQSVFYSAALQITNYDNLWDQGTSGSTVAGPSNRGLMLGFNTVGPTQTNLPSVAGARIFVRKGSTPDTFQFGFSKNSVTVANTAWDTTDYPLFDTNNNPITYFVVGQYTLKNRTTNTDDDAAVWINPDPSTFSATPPQPTFSTVSLGTGLYQPSIDGNDLSTNSIQSIMFMQKGQAGQATGQVVDELRIDTRWSGVTPVAGTTYTATGSGTWSVGSNWSGGSAPSAAGATVNLAQQAAAATVTLATGQTVGTLNIDSSNGYTLDGAGPLTLSGDATINSTKGAHTISAPVAVATSLNVNLATAASLAVTSDLTFAPGATLTKAGAGTMTVKNVRADAVTVIGQGSTLQIAPDGTNAGVSVVKSLSIPTITSPSAAALPPVSKLDLTNNTLIYDYTGTSPLTNSLPDASAPRLLDLIGTYGYAGGNWTGTGIVSSTAAADPKKVTGIGYAEASVLKGLSGTDTATFDGQSVDATTLILKVTLYGDLNLDGKIDGDDYAALDRSAASGNFTSGTSARWTDGDFNYDGLIDQNDYLLIDKSLGVQQGTLSPAFLAMREAQFGDAYVSALVAAVPEPASLGLLGLAGVTCLTRRRRK